MASIYRQPRSPFWWLKWRNPTNGRIERFSTGHRHGLAKESQQARILQAEYSLKELKEAPRAQEESRWENWVDTFLANHYSGSPLSLSRYQICWRHLQPYLIEKKIFSPRHLRRKQAQDYMAWRIAQKHANSNRKPIGRNTILLELKCLGSIMGEALNRGWVEYNPCHRLGFKRTPARWKDEYSDSDIAIIRAEIARRQAKAKTAAEKARANFFHVSFEIAMAQSFRLNETYFPLSDVDFEQKTVTLTFKGQRLETKSLNPSIMPLLLKLRAKKARFTYEQPPMPSLKWWKFFDDLRAKHPSFVNISFHSTRATFISRSERLGVPEKVVMEAANHASTTVHRLYRHVQRSEMAALWQAVNSTQPPGADKHPAPETSGVLPASPAPTS